MKICFSIVSYEIDVLTNDKEEIVLKNRKI